MGCPRCGATTPSDAVECLSCGVIFAKWRPPAPRPPAPAPSVLPLPALPPREAWLAASLPALYCSWRFRDWLPLPQGWADLERWWFPLAALNLVFHEAGHAIVGMLGIPFLTTAGGTLLQLALPAAVLAHFLKRSERAGVGFSLFWLGINFVNISFYAADAQQQVIILISGMSGSEGGGHDWGYMLDCFGLKGWSVGIGRLLHAAGACLMAVAPAWAAAHAWRSRAATESRTGTEPPGEGAGTPPR